MTYRYMVDTQNPGHIKMYDGTDVADAMAAFSKSISDGVEYVTLEALHDLVKEADRSGGTTNERRMVLAGLGGH